MFFLFVVASRPDLGPSQSTVHWASGAISSGVKQWGVKLTTLSHNAKVKNAFELYLHSPSTFPSHGILLSTETKFTFTTG